MENDMNFPFQQGPVIPPNPLEKKPEVPFYNKFLQAGREGKNEWWRYLVGILLTFGAGYSIIGAIPVTMIALRGVINHYYTLEELSAKSENMESPAFMHVDTNVLLASLLFIFVAAMFFLWIAVRFVHKKRFLAIINRGESRFDFKRFFLAAGIWLVFSIIFLAISYFLDPTGLKLVFHPGPFIGTVLICLVMLPIQTGWEELFIRGYLMQGFGLWIKKPIWPLLITSVIFGLLHMANAEVKANGVALMLPQYILPGLIFGVIALLDERLELAMGLHFANNFFSIITVTSPQMSVQANAIWSVDSVGGAMDAVGSAVPLLLVLGVLWRIYKWDSSKLVRAY